MSAHERRLEAAVRSLLRNVWDPVVKELNKMSVRYCRWDGSTHPMLDDLNRPVYGINICGELLEIS